jgi:hypothetical protein
MGRVCRLVFRSMTSHYISYILCDYGVLITDKTNCMKPTFYGQASSCVARPNVSPHFMESAASLPYSEKAAVDPYSGSNLAIPHLDNLRLLYPFQYILIYSSESYKRSLPELYVRVFSSIPGQSQPH